METLKDQNQNQNQNQEREQSKGCMLVYNSNHSSVYKRIEEDFLNSLAYTKEEIVLLCDHTYRMEILSVFRMRVFDETEMNEKVSILYDSCKISTELMACARSLSGEELDLEIGFRVFFSYDYFYLAHKCISEFLKSGQVSKDSFNSFLSKANENSTDENS
jgi:hypothetical protein